MSGKVYVLTCTKKKKNTFYFITLETFRLTGSCIFDSRIYEVLIKKVPVKINTQIHITEQTNLTNKKLEKRNIATYEMKTRTAKKINPYIIYR